MVRLERRRTRISNSEIRRAVVRHLLRNITLFFVLATSLGFLVHFLSDPLRETASYRSWLWTANGPYLVVFLLLLPIFVRDTVRLVNRIAGPWFRLRAALRAVNAGEDPGLLRFRQGDFGHELAAEFNVLVERLRQAESEVKQREAGSVPQEMTQY
jgi:hypothetical protein